MTDRKSEADIAWASAAHNLETQREFLELVPWREGASILDIGCGPGVHVQYFLEKGLKPTGLDRNTANFRFADQARIVQDAKDLEGETFDYLFASHVLEHCPNTLQALQEWKQFLKPDGVIVVFVPPFFDEVSNDHWVTGWNVGQLGMTLVAAGFDCSASHFGQSDSQVFGYGRREDEHKPGFFIEENLPYLPGPVRRGLVFTGNQNLRGDIAFLSPDDIEYASRPRRMVSIGVPDDTWPSIYGKEGDSDLVLDKLVLPKLERGVDYVLAVEAIGAAALVRLCLIEGTDEDPFARQLELWENYPPGLSLRQFHLVDMVRRGERLDPERISTIVFGGRDIKASEVRFALFGPDARRLI